MSELWAPTPIIGPELVEELGRELYQYAVSIKNPTIVQSPRSGEEQRTYEVIHEHVPAMIVDATTMVGGVQERITPTLTLEMSLSKIALGGYFPRVDNGAVVIDEASGLEYNIVSVDHPMNMTTILYGMRQSPGEEL